ncbi:Fe-S cluster assembly protein HesB [Candidatus Gottesmanbacteria bacterium]|nr:Fe-S cluster assembly protein HesB [Candidatus Gottesmanbacteria bacterium]
MKLPKKKIVSFQQKVFTWWSTHKRDLPWRRTRDPYRIMVSEVMLQQTQVLRVVAKYREFIERYPRVSNLAHATPAEVLRIWKGLGYNRRALYLHRAAKTIAEAYHGKFPINERELIKLPGLGTYTARAILVFAYKQEVPLVDTNIRQIITHFFFADQPQKASVIEDVARKLLPKGKSWQWHQALMDYGALELRNIQINKYTNKQMEKIPFRESNRFYRGRIIDRLREGEISEKKFLNELGKTYTKPVAFLHSIIASLVKDGLIERTSRGVLRLPV